MYLKRFWNVVTTKTLTPLRAPEFRQTDAPAGSRAKIDILAERVLRGLPLWHPEDRTDYSGLTGSVRPRV